MGLIESRNINETQTTSQYPVKYIQTSQRKWNRKTNAEIVFQDGSAFCLGYWEVWYHNTISSLGEWDAKREEEEGEVNNFHDAFCNLIGIGFINNSPKEGIVYFLRSTY